MVWIYVCDYCCTGLIQQVVNSLEFSKARHIIGGSG